MGRKDERMDGRRFAMKKNASFLPFGSRVAYSPVSLMEC